MLLAKFQGIVPVAVGFSVFLASQLTRAGDKEPTRQVVETKLDLTRESMPKLLALIRPQENEWRHLKVEWLTDVVAARKRAVAEDKPIIICYTGGAGYNEPLGVC
jgi:hypothetical protein